LLIGAISEASRVQCLNRRHLDDAGDYSENDPIRKRGSLRPKAGRGKTLIDTRRTAHFRKVGAIVPIALATIIATGFQATHPTPVAPSQPAPSVPNQNRAPATANTAAFVSGSKINPPIPNYRFQEGQTFTYSVDWRLVTAGRATVRLDNVNGEHHVVVDADSTGAVALLYHVRDRLETFYHPPTNCVLALTKHTEEGFRRVETKVRYDYGRKKA